jgi:uncharacterized membrane protein YeaQ/YmgE (transglycosylase-associated protein family)
LVILVFGLVAGWLAGKIVREAGFGLISDLLIGVIGAFIGDWLLPRIGIHLGTGTPVTARKAFWRVAPSDRFNFLVFQPPELSYPPVTSAHELVLTPT